VGVLAPNLGGFSVGVCDRESGGTEMARIEVCWMIYLLLLA